MDITTRAKNQYVAACIRALRTFIHMVVAGIPTGAMIDDVSWLVVLNLAGVAALVSLLHGLLGALPEVDEA